MSWSWHWRVAVAEPRLPPAPPRAAWQVLSDHAAAYPHLSARCSRERHMMDVLSKASRVNLQDLRSTQS